MKTVLFISVIFLGFNAFANDGHDYFCLSNQILESQCFNEVDVSESVQTLRVKLEAGKEVMTYSYGDEFFALSHVKGNEALNTFFFQANNGDYGLFREFNEMQIGYNLVEATATLTLEGETTSYGCVKN